MADKVTGGAATGPHVLRRMNLAAVSKALREHTSHSARITDLVCATGLSRPAVGRALDDLRRAGLVEFTADAPAPSMGRPAQQVRFRAEAGHVAGVDIGPYKALVMVADLAGNVLASHRATMPDLPDGRRVFEAVRSALVAASAEAAVPVESLWAVTVGTPGVIDQGEILLAPSIPGWAGLPVRRMLSRWLGCPVHLDNDVNLAVLGERWRGAAPDADDLVFVQWGERIGTGILIGGKPYRGASSAAGELGFIDVMSGADRGVGHRPGEAMGSFESLVGAKAIRELAQDMGAVGEAGRDIAALFAVASEGSPTALAVLDRVAARFSRGLATLLLLLDPGLVVIGGGVSRGGDILLEPILRHLEHQTLVPTEVRLSLLGETATACGAVAHALASVESRLVAGTDAAVTRGG
ncbi:ROK family transcriptional regulator [Streptomyces parvus]|uniref:ROK family transcriptional regulator n=1 Tax=Streptomyces parvus TaxID=66428 RepID=UPI0033F9ADFF